MKVMKWVCRYVFMALLLAGAIAFWLYCNSSAAKLEAQTNTLEYVDLAVSLSPDAIAKLSRIKELEQLGTQGMYVAIAIGACLLLLIIYHITSGILKKKMPQWKAAREAKAAAAQAASAPAAPKGFTQPFFEQPKPAVSEPAPAVVQAPVITEAAETTAPEAAEPPTVGGYCTNCGQYYSELPVFCTRCGNRITNE